MTVRAMLGVLMLGGLVALPMVAQSADDAAIQVDVRKILKDKRFGGVQPTVAGGVVTLSGQVVLLADRMDAEKKVLKDKEVASVKNELRVVGGVEVSDVELFHKLAKDLTYDRESYGTTMFNAMSMDVRGGVVTVSGVVVTPADKDAALSLIAATPGVRGLVDKLEVAPLSPMDDRIRRAEAQAVYGAAQLNRYALNPAKPIRISVVNGNVTLSGVVDSQADKTIAGLKANGVGGVFSVKNELVVAGQVER